MRKCTEDDELDSSLKRKTNIGLSCSSQSASCAMKGPFSMVVQGIITHEGHVWAKVANVHISEILAFYLENILSWEGEKECYIF